MFALVLHGLRRQGIAPPKPPSAGARTQAGAPLVPHACKRDLLGAVLVRDGPIAILRVGEAILDQGFDPMLHALLRASGPVDLIRRWLRLERYAHSHHRTVAEHLGSDGARLRHISLRGAPPSPAEDLLVLGVYIGLLRAVGCSDLSASIGEQRVALPDGRWDTGAVERVAAAADTAIWRLAWSGRPATFAARSDDLPSSLAAASGNCPEADRLADLLARDPARNWPLAEAAAELGLSARGLQRRLSLHGLTSSAVGRAVRVRHACALLAAGEHPLATIGFVSGFSDQAHFTREFRRQVNMTPGAYRALSRDTA
jgi:AraC-like DNA-binding protein